MITNIDSLSVQIKEQYALAEENFGKAKEYQSKALIYAKNCGELLIEAKSKCQHGTWLNWLETNTQIPQRTAQRYMQFALSWDVIEPELNNSEKLNFGINDAQRLLTEKKKNATMADLTVRDCKALIFDSIERQKDIEKRFKDEEKKIISKYKSFENFEKVKKSLDNGENIKSNNLVNLENSDSTIDVFTDKEKHFIHEQAIKINTLEVNYQEEQMRQIWLKAKIELNLNPTDWERWIELEFDLKPKMVYEFITTDKSLFFDLFFDYYSDNEFIEKIKKMHSCTA
ncbi:DUF3102 domain-containing protein [Cyanobacterium aponinum AL20118]|uniref:DUF3102 domain-containing protein n=1 Tax=Cyanobacterium aponinum AL20115 TaxID=3090662 RepID=A0AAF0ZAG5_9CHRO|nr:DUF3102 domain-containing protein [Cyanobacterium aponinum]WPF89416.1 DUF3102 domain-containing protein [Cyanobacterium aponinum AL20115]